MASSIDVQNSLASTVPAPSTSSKEDSSTIVHLSSSRADPNFSDNLGLEDSDLEVGPVRSQVISLSSVRSSVIREANRVNNRPQGICFYAMICLAALTFGCSVAGLFWPRYPPWEITALSFTNETKDGLMRAFTDPNFNGTEQFDGIAAIVSFWNRNFLGVHASPSQFTIWYDSHEIGHAECDAFPIPGRDKVSVRSRAALVFNPELSKMVLKGVQANNWTLTVMATGSLLVHVLGPLYVKVSVACEVLSDTLQLVKDPNLMVKGHTCSYTLGL